MSIINYHDPTVINWNLDNSGNLISVPIENEVKQIVDGKIPLEGLPDEQYRIQITGYVEINIKDKIDAPNKFKCDYTHGVLYFDQSKNGTNININKYYSRGQFYMASSRIWTKLSSTGEVLETMGDVEERLGEISGVITNLDGSINTAKGLKTELNTSVTSGTTLNTNLQTSIDTATTKKTQLDSSTSVSTTSKSNLDTSIASANTSKSNLDVSIGNATTSKTNLDSSISSGNTLKTNLDENIATGTTLKNNLDTNITTGNQLKVDLPPLISDAGTAKTNLDGSIATSTTKKSELDGSISLAITKKTDLDSSISSANTINSTLSNSTTGTIKKANDANSTLNTSIDDSASSKTVLDESIATANTSKTNLDASVTTANTTKTGLDGSITTGNALKSELGDIISGTDYEQVLIDVNSMKQDQHSHDNKESVLDNLTDVSDKLKYKGQDIGIGDMEKQIYDTNNNGKVDVAENAEKLGGQLPDYYAKTTDIPNISGKTDKIYVDTEIGNKVDNSRVLTDVPLNAKFTDTITTINGKTGAITKSDITALGIPAQDTIYGVATTSTNGLMSSTDKQNLDASTTSRHTHINKPVIDKFTEVSGKPYYNGEEIGGAVPNLTLNELTLGGRFKIVYNDIEDSLDIEVI